MAVSQTEQIKKLRKRNTEMTKVLGSIRTRLIEEEEHANKFYNLLRQTDERVQMLLASVALLGKMHGGPYYQLTLQMANCEKAMRLRAEGRDRCS
jgi:hypothetical protein